MATNLLIADAGLVIDGATTTLSVTESSTYPLSNLFGGSKVDRFEVATAATGDTRIKFTCPSALPADFIYLGAARALQENFVGTITVKGHSADNYGAATTVATISSFGSATLVGPYEEDYIVTFNEASYAYWWVNFNSSADSAFPLGKLFLGSSFDPGRDPNQPMVVTRTRPTGGRRKALYTFEFTWEGLSYANTVTLLHRYYRNRRHAPVVLYTTDYHDALLSSRVLFGRITSMSAPPRVTGVNDVSLTFEEMA